MATAEQEGEDHRVFHMPRVRTHLLGLGMCDGHVITLLDSLARSHHVYLLQALALTPVIVFKSRKFAALFTLGSLFSMGR